VNWTAAQFSPMMERFFQRALLCYGLLMVFEGVSDVVRKRMAVIRKTGSKPERLVRRLAHGLGYRFRINRRDLAGTPDIVFPRLRKAIFVHGCFWHQHEGCRHANVPRIREAYWLPKLARTKERDADALQKLKSLGWTCLVVWECETKRVEELRRSLAAFLSDSSQVDPNYSGGD
jgi:DNA mismatch endonuclease, patch repair protein